MRGASASEVLESRGSLGVKMNCSQYPGVILVQIRSRSHLRVGRNTFGGLGITILDSLSTLWLMELDEEFKKALKFVREDLDFDQADGDVSVFEVTIRALGGLLGAHTLSGKEVLLERAQELGNRLLPAFQTASKMPWPTVNLARGTSKPSREPVILSEAGRKA